VLCVGSPTWQDRLRAVLPIVTTSNMAKPQSDKPEADSVRLVSFKRGRAGKRRQRYAVDDDEEDDAVIKTAKPELKGAIKVSNAAERPADDPATYRGAGEIQQSGDMGATRALEENTERALDKRTQREAGMGAGADDGKYHGQRGYKDYREVRPWHCPVASAEQHCAAGRGDGM
jgi:hypothetical protein